MRLLPLSFYPVYVCVFGNGVAGSALMMRCLFFNDGLGRIYPMLLLNNAVHRLLLALVNDKFSIQVITTRYMMTT